MERFWDGENWGPHPRRIRGAEVEPNEEPTSPDIADRDYHAGAAELPSVWSRITARSVDILVLLFPWYWAVTRSVSRSTDAAGNEVTTTNLAYLALVAVLVVGYEVVLTSRFGGTIGKRVVGLRVIDKDTRITPPGIAKSVMRATPLLLAISILVVLLWVACVVAMYVDRKQRRSVFDFSGGTMVIVDPAGSGLLGKRS